MSHVVGDIIRKRIYKSELASEINVALPPLIDSASFIDVSKNPTVSNVIVAVYKYTGRYSDNLYEYEFVGVKSI